MTDATELIDTPPSKRTFFEREALKASLWLVVWKLIDADEHGKADLVKQAILELDHMQELIDQFPDNYPSDQWS